jgi:hypothetical protein
MTSTPQSLMHYRTYFGTCSPLRAWNGAPRKTPAPLRTGWGFFLFRFPKQRAAQNRAPFPNTQQPFHCWLSCSIVSLARRAHVAAMSINATCCEGRSTILERLRHSAARARHSSGVSCFSSAMSRPVLGCRRPKRPAVPSAQTVWDCSPSAQSSWVARPHP